MNDFKSLQANEYFKNLKKLGKCTKCKIVLTLDKYKKGRTVCKLCYNHHVLTYYRTIVIIHLLKQMLALKQTFQINRKFQINKMVRKNKLDMVNMIVQINKIVLKI